MGTSPCAARLVTLTFGRGRKFQRACLPKDLVRFDRERGAELVSERRAEAARYRQVAQSIPSSTNRILFPSQ